MASDKFLECLVEDIAANARNAIVGGPFGSDLVSKDYVLSGVPVIRGANMGYGRWVSGEFVYVTNEKADSLSSNCARAGDIIFTQRGTLGQVALIPNGTTERYLVSQSQMKLTVDSRKADALFLYYVFTGAEQQEFIRTNAIQTGVPHTNLGILKKTPVRLPSLNRQKSIARILASLDDKIDLNRRINQTLEAMAQALFKSWFVDFDPVKAKIAAIQEGRDPLRAAMSAISGKSDAELDALPREQVAHLAVTAALFPDEMEASELGEVPRGWEVQRVDNLLELVYGKALKTSDRRDGTFRVYGSGGITGYHDAALVPHGSIILGRKGTVGSLYWEDEPFFPIDTTYYVRPLNAPLTYCYYAMQTLGLKEMNTDAAVPGLNRENVYRLELVRPSASVLHEFDVKVSTLRRAIRANSGTSTALADLRDTLLPKLLSGELSVAEAVAETET